MPALLRPCRAAKIHFMSFLRAPFPRDQFHPEAVVPAASAFLMPAPRSFIGSEVGLVGESDPAVSSRSKSRASGFSLCWSEILDAWRDHARG